MVSTIESASLDVRTDIPSPSIPCILCFRQCSQYFLCYAGHLDCSGSGDAFDFFADESD